MYTNEIFINPEGLQCHTIDTINLSFAGSARAKHNALLLITRATGGENVSSTTPCGKVLSIAIPNAGDAIFQSALNDADRYVPTDANGRYWKFDSIRDRGYTIRFVDWSNSTLLAQCDTIFKVLIGVVDRPSCIKHAYGQGKHQFVYSGASIRLNPDGTIRGIPAEEFAYCWSILPASTGSAGPPPLPLDKIRLDTDLSLGYLT